MKIYLSVGALLTHRVLLQAAGVRWLIVDALVPLAVGGLGFAFHSELSQP